jgi:hypothetical protein
VPFVEQPQIVASVDGGVPTPPTLRFDHLRRLTAPHGLWEHALLTTPRREHGSCTDDNARALMLVCSQPVSGSLDDLASVYLRFLQEAQGIDGVFRDRRAADGTWLEADGSDDAQGRARWALGSSARHAMDAQLRQQAEEAFLRCGPLRSHHLRSNAYAALGAVEYLVVRPDHTATVTSLRSAAEVLVDGVGQGRWPWPEPRLTYDNARIPEAMLAIGESLGEPDLVGTGLDLLTWLVSVESEHRRFSFTPVGGRGPGERGPAFDQQPIEASAMTDACRRAWQITGDPVWQACALAATAWFLGRNDNGRPLYDRSTGGTADGLTRGGVNLNQGAESTIAGLSALAAAVDLAVPVG